MGDVLAGDIAGFLPVAAGEEGIAPHPIALVDEEGPDVVGVGVEREDVGAVDLGVEAPNRVDAGWVAEVPEAGDEGVVLGGEFDDSGLVEEAKEFDTGSADKTITELGFVGAVGFA